MMIMWLLSSGRALISPLRSANGPAGLDPVEAGGTVS
jgi:hypothetical protein